MNVEPIVVEESFRASLERVWRAITDAELMRRWFFETMKEFQPRPGFTTEFTVHHDNRDYVHRWKVAEVSPTKRIVVDWSYGGVQGASVVTWELAEAPGGTKLRLTHAGVETFPQDDPAFRRQSCESGWKRFLSHRLKTFLDSSIEKRVTLRAPQARVWRALTDAREFGRWFGVKLEGDFVAGKTVTGIFDEQLNESAILEYQKAIGLPPSKVRMPATNEVFCTVDRIEPERYFAFRWIPYGIDAEVDPKNEPTTLVEFRLEEVESGTLLTITESGFDRVPAHRRERAFRMNDGGWTAQAENIRKYVESA